MISDGSYDTKDWNSRCFAIIGILFFFFLNYIKIENFFLTGIIFHNILLHLKKLPTPNIWTVMYMAIIKILY